MAAKAKVTREMIAEAAFALVREEGHEALSARRVAARLHCSTQPLLYHFPNTAAIRRAAYERADAFHSAFITGTQPDCDDPLLAIGMRYVRFAAEEGPLFRFLFQSGEFAGQSLGELVDAPAVEPLVGAAAQAAGIAPARAKALFAALFICAHGWASLLANNAMRYDPEALRESLTAVFEGMAANMGGEDHEEAE